VADENDASVGLGLTAETLVERWNRLASAELNIPRLSLTRTDGFGTSFEDRTFAGSLALTGARLEDRTVRFARIYWTPHDEVVLTAEAAERVNEAYRLFIQLLVGEDEDGADLLLRSLGLPPNLQALGDPSDRSIVVRGVRLHLLVADDTFAGNRHVYLFATGVP
jgi:hypothetical protein